MNPKRYPKSELPLSAAPQVDRWLNRTRDAILAIVVLSLLVFLGGLQGVKAADPTPSPIVRCLYCLSGDPGPTLRPAGTPLPRRTLSPIVAARPTASPQRTLPPTDTAP